MGMTVDVTSYQDAFANFDKGIAILNLILPLERYQQNRAIFSSIQRSTLPESSFSVMKVPIMGKWALPFPVIVKSLRNMIDTSSQQ